MKTEYEGKTAEELAAMLEQKDSALEQAESAKTATVSELKDLRTKKQELEAALEQAKQTKEPVAAGANTAEEVERILSEKAANEAKANREKAIEEFRSQNHEFSEAADPGGIKFAAFERELKKFNFDGLSTVNDFNSRLKEVHEFMNRGQKPDTDKSSHHIGTPRVNEGADPNGNDDYELDPREKKLLAQTGWTLERYKALREKQPAFVESQLAFVN